MMLLISKRTLKRFSYFLIVTFSTSVIFTLYLFSNTQENFFVTKRNVEHTLEEALKKDEGTGCKIQNLDPVAPEIMELNIKKHELVSCEGQNLVRCYFSKCKVDKNAVKDFIGFSCTYRDIIYESKQKHRLGASTVLAETHEYTLKESDHVKIQCTWKTKGNDTKSWTGHGWGIRSSLQAPKPPKGKENTINVLILGFESTTHNGFIRKMPMSYDYLKYDLGASVLKGYNVVGDGTPAVLLPILTGKTELELLETRKSTRGTGYIDENCFIFSKLKNYGYRTAYIQNLPWMGTFHYDFNDFKTQPADHYARAFFDEESDGGKNWINMRTRYCVGGTLSSQLMMNITRQFFMIGGKRFVFTFISEISQNDFPMTSTADIAFVEFLLDLRSHLQNTLLIVMGDHGPRHSDVGKTYQEKLEERLPLMVIRLPDQLKQIRPKAQKALEVNTNVLTTPHDIHAMILDALDLRHHWNAYKIKGAKLSRGMTLLKQIPWNRSCSEAGIQPHLCTCLHQDWEVVPKSDPLHMRVVQTLVLAINGYTYFQRSKCAVRVLKTVERVMKNKEKDHGEFLGMSQSGILTNFPKKYQVEVTLDPGNAWYKAVVAYNPKTDKFEVDSRQISRGDIFEDESSCISKLFPHIKMYCYCLNRTLVL